MTEHRITVRMAIRIAAALLIVSAAGIALFALREYRRQKDTSDLVYTRSIRLMDAVTANRTAIAALQNAEVQEQNYILTGETSYSEAYAASVTEWQDAVGVLGVQTANRGIGNLVQDLSKAGDRTVAELASIISLYDGGSRDKALDRIRKGSGIVYLNQARDISAQVGADSNEALGAQLSLSAFSGARPVRRIAGAVAGLFCLMVIGASLLFLTTRRLSRTIASDPHATEKPGPGLQLENPDRLRSF